MYVQQLVLFPRKCSISQGLQNIYVPVCFYEVSPGWHLLPRNSTEVYSNFRKKKSANGEEYAYTSDSPQKLFSCSSDIFSIKPDKYFSFVCLLSSECYLNLG